MTATYSLPDSITSKLKFRSKPVDPEAIKVVIPTYKDWDGLRTTLESLRNLKTPPRSIVVANDNVESDIPNWLTKYPVEVVNYPGNFGPAVARNRGFGLRDFDLTPEFELKLQVSSVAGLMAGERKRATSLAIPNLTISQEGKNPRIFEWNGAEHWVYFTDCGCEHDPEIFIRFQETWQAYGDSCAAICGPVEGSGSGPINEYMTEQRVLNPPGEQVIHGAYIPQALITANALIASLPFAFIGGFDKFFQEAAGEDLDIGIRLRELGIIGWSPDAKARHEFVESESDFISRFRRYGRGNRRLEMKHQLPSLRARPFEAARADIPMHQRLARLSVEAMQEGYDEAIDHSARGKILEF